jgi:hypothetical protein
MTHQGLLEDDDGVEEAAAAVAVGGLRLDGGVRAHLCGEEVQNRRQRLEALEELLLSRLLEAGEGVLHHVQGARDPTAQELVVEGGGPDPLLTLLHLLSEEPLKL